MLDPAGQRQIIQNNLPFLYNPLSKDKKRLIILLNEIIFENRKLFKLTSILTIIDY